MMHKLCLCGKWKSFQSFHHYTVLINLLEENLYLKTMHAEITKFRNKTFYRLVTRGDSVRVKKFEHLNKISKRVRNTNFINIKHNTRVTYTFRNFLN